MLTHLTVKNLAIVDELELSFTPGMHAITGETGAGKSIIIDALSIALGERAFVDHIRAGQTQAEVTASFNISNIAAVQELLIQQELPAEECVIRRIINTDGRSRAYINGCAVSVQQIKTLAPYLVHIHSQHQHHALLDSEYQRQLLDEYAEHTELLLEVKRLYHEWLAIKQQIQLLTDGQKQADKLALLNYQLQELESLSIQVDEVKILNQKHTELAQADELLATCQRISATISGDTEIETDKNNLLDQLHNIATQLNNIGKITPQLMPSMELIKQAIINLTEANAELSSYIEKLDLDPQQLLLVEQRLTNIHAIARKLKVTPEFLHQHYLELCKQHQTLISATAQLETLQQQLQVVAQNYMLVAEKLSSSRNSAGTRLAAAVIERLKSLEMPNAKFIVHYEKNKHKDLTPYGNESINFMVCTNPGQSLGPLKKIASGGELSRISLAIQVITAQKISIPTLILDEVDVGISGKTAATVGALIRELSCNAQILCITHLAQVAAQAHSHFKVQKTQSTETTCTQIINLSPKERATELARLIGGINLTAEALAHAQQLLESVNT